MQKKNYHIIFEACKEYARKGSFFSCNSPYSLNGIEAIALPL